ncbi:MAG: hypothetical protein M1832_002850 [Thelocarpon impressellum]|nr:MAG: hypothetical protein M1832_002850 [Thelocarpon impressellum]
MACPLNAILNADPEPEPPSSSGEAAEILGDQRQEAQSRVGGRQPRRIAVPSTSVYPRPEDNDGGSKSNRVANGQQSPRRLPLTPPPSDDRDNSQQGLPDTSANQSTGFTIFSRLFSHAEILFEVARHLEFEGLLSLYAISRDFHEHVDARMTTTMLGHSLRLAPESSRTFLFKAYRSLCIPDPARRPDPRHAQEVRMVPGFRWLRMVLYRESIVAEIVAALATEGHRLPPRASLTLKRMWLTMDVGTNVKRIGLLHNRAFWTDEDLYVATLFFIKLDMRLMDPVDGDGETALRKLMLGQRSLTPLHRLLRRRGGLSRLDILRMQVRYDYTPSPAHRGLSILGIPASEIGIGHREGWGSGTSRAKLMRPDKLVMQEALRRGLGLEKRYMDMLLWGYIDLQTFEDVPVRPEEMLPEEEAEHEQLARILSAAKPFSGWGRPPDDRDLQEVSASTMGEVLDADAMEAS